MRTVPGGICGGEPGELDAERFQGLIDAGRSASPPAARRRGRRAAQALAMWRGPPLADLAFEQFAQAEIAR